VLVVSYLFVSANLNAVANNEYYYFFLGLCYAAGRSSRAERYSLAVATG
jgi:hypothetical protein